MMTHCWLSSPPASARPIAGSARLMAVVSTWPRKSPRQVASRVRIGLATGLRPGGASGVDSMVRPWIDRSSTLSPQRFDPGRTEPGVAAELGERVPISVLPPDRMNMDRSLIAAPPPRSPDVGIRLSSGIPRRSTGVPRDGRPAAGLDRRVAAQRGPQLIPADDAELAVHVRQVMLDGPGTHVEVVADVLVRPTVRGPHGDPVLVRAEQDRWADRGRHAASVPHRNSTWMVWKIDQAWHRLRYAAESGNPNTTHAGLMR